MTSEQSPLEDLGIEADVAQTLQICIVETKEHKGKIQFPVFDEVGSVVGVGFLSNDSTWDYTPGTYRDEVVHGSHFIFSMLEEDDLLRSRNDTIMVVFDLLTYAQMVGTCSVVAILSGEVTERQREVLRELRIAGFSGVFLKVPRKTTTLPSEKKILSELSLD